MSPKSPDRPQGELGRQLLAAARDDAPPASSRQRALALIDSSELPESPSTPILAGARRRPDRRWLHWALAAAAVFAGAVAFALLKPSKDSSAVAVEPVATAPLAATATAANDELAMPTPEPSASASASAVATAGPPPPAVAAKGTSGPPSASANVTTKPTPRSAGSGSCGCSPDDLMCHMRCAEKK